jgi:hypothetical protein
VVEAGAPYTLTGGTSQSVTASCGTDSLLGVSARVGGTPTGEVVLSAFPSDAGGAPVTSGAAHFGTANAFDDAGSPATGTLEVYAICGKP